jgi:hypothetical protein
MLIRKKCKKGLRFISEMVGKAYGNGSFGLSFWNRVEINLFYNVN